MKKILVPIDFSTCADNAVDFAVKSSKLFPAEITLLHVLEMKGNAYTDYMGVNREFNQSLRDENDQKLTLLKKKIETEKGVVVHTEVITGVVNDAIIEAGATRHIDLVIMGTLGASGLKENLWGTKTGLVIGNTKVPVIVIPYDYHWIKPEKILLATNRFEKDRAILDFLFDLADRYMAQVHVAVFSDPEHDSAFTLLENTRNCAQYETMLRNKYNNNTLTAMHLYGKSFEETLQAHMVKNGIDILAMVPYKRKFLDQLFHPSKTKRMSYHTRIPLLVIPAKVSIDTESW